MHRRGLSRNFALRFGGGAHRERSRVFWRPFCCSPILCILLHRASWACPGAELAVLGRGSGFRLLLFALWFQGNLNGTHGRRGWGAIGRVRGQPRAAPVVIRSASTTAVPLVGLARLAVLFLRRLCWRALALGRVRFAFLPGHRGLCRPYRGRIIGPLVARWRAAARRIAWWGFLFPARRRSVLPRHGWEQVGAARAR